MAFLIGGFGFDGAAAAGWPIPPVIGGYLLRAGLATAALALLPGVVDFITTVRRAGGRTVLKTIAHAVLAVAAMATFAAALRQRGDSASVATTAVLEVLTGKNLCI